MRLLATWLLVACVRFTPILAASDPVVVKSDPFDNAPYILFYFEDSPVILSFDSKLGNVWRSENDGQDWAQVEEVKGKAGDVMEHPFDKERAIILGGEAQTGERKTTNWATKDRGKTWQKFVAELPTSFLQAPIYFHAKNPDYVLYAGRECDPVDFFGPSCVDHTYYTLDWFKSEMKLLRKKTHTCIFAHGTAIFDSSKSTPDSTILCIVDGQDILPEHRKLVVSKSFFEKEEEPLLDGYMTVRGVAGLVSVQKFIVAAVRNEGTDQMSLYVTDDTIVWDHAEFPEDHGGLQEDAYTILESTPYSIQVDVLTTKPQNPIGELFTSNSNGSYFTRNLDNTNRNFEGLVDFEQVAGIDGIVLANVVKNYEQVRGNPRMEKQLVSKISFDDGRFDTWQDLKAKGGSLHLHSFTQLANGGRVFSSPAPGLLMGVGNIGDYLKPYTDGDLYVSNDAGLTWSKALDDAHKYEFGGAGSILVAINDESATDEVKYSLNHGENWASVQLPKPKVRARLLTTTPDSTSMKFILVGIAPDKKAYIFMLDFSGVLDRECKLDKDHEDKSDIERWAARLDEEGKPDCLMGHKQYFWRRKKNAVCFVKNLYNEPQPESEVCECTDHDFECDFNFVRANGKKDAECVLAKGAKLSVPKGECRTPEDEFQATTGYRKIPGNDCKGGLKKDGKKSWKCNEASSAPQRGDIKDKVTEFEGPGPEEYFYLDTEKKSKAKAREEAIVMRIKYQLGVFVSHDHGNTWNHDLKDVDVRAIYPNMHNTNMVYFVTGKDELWYTDDRGHTFDKIKVPTLPNLHDLQVIDFHPNPQRKDWLIWTGQRSCSEPSKCESVAYYTKSRGETWDELTANAGACKWVRGAQQVVVSDTLIFCERFSKDDTSPEKLKQLVASDDFFNHEKVHFSHIVGFTTMEEFIIVASINEDGSSLQASASIDGKTFMDAKFPHNFNVPHQTAYTVLESDTHAVFLHVTVNPNTEFEFGSLLKSDSEGKDYVLSLDAVNRNAGAYVDFEKMHSLEGIAIVNRVINHEAVVLGEAKRLRTMITHNDGGEWSYIPPPAKDVNGKDYKCTGQKLEQCSLNLHHYTERTDARHTFSSASAVGLMVGVGNVGDVLTGLPDGDTFLTSDGGVTWQEVRKGQHLWEYGDQGSIIVLVDHAKATDRVIYTLDQGKTWAEYQISEKLLINDISTVPSDTSRKFLLWGTKEGGRDKFFTVQLDFTGLTDIQCNLNIAHPEEDDFELWSPRDDNHCLFGHVAQYHRKIPDHNCYIGQNIGQPHKVLKNCTCTTQDYECDFNYERQNDGTCKLIPGLPMPNHAAICDNDPSAVEYWVPTGYRRLPMSTCENGDQLDKVSSKPCPGKEGQYRKKHPRIGGFGLFLAIFLPIVAAASVGYYVWTRILDGRVGTIRLGEDSSDSLFVRIPIVVVSAVVAFAAAVPQILSALGGWMGSKLTRTRRYTTRSSFARGDYSAVNNDEGELLGSDEEDDV